MVRGRLESSGGEDDIGASSAVGMAYYWRTALETCAVFPYRSKEIMRELYSIILLPDWPPGYRVGGTEKTHQPGSHPAAPCRVQNKLFQKHKAQSQSELASELAGKPPIPL